MNNLKVTRILKHAWGSVTNSYFVWLGGLLLIGLPLVMLATRLTPQISDWSYQSILSLTGLSFLIAFGLAYIDKFALTAVRNMQLVRLYFGRAVWYSISDGFFTRLLYSFIVSAVQVLAFYIGWSTIGESFGIVDLFSFYRMAISPEAVLLFQLLFPFLFVVFYCLFIFLVDSHFFLLPYIIQDTSSADNAARPLPFMGCLKKSVLLIEGHRGAYVWLNLCLLLLAMLGGYAGNFLVMLLVQFVGPFLGDNIQLLYDILMVPGFVLVSSFSIFSLSARTMFANALMENDLEVADFGD